MPRFPDRPANDAADPHAIASLALVRALTAYLVGTGRLHIDELSAIQAAALEDLTDETGPGLDAARAVIEHAFP